jgi:CheY-like chemotaxis protein
MMGRTDGLLVGIHVLVVEDHDDSREVWKHAIEYSGARVSAASSSRQALEFFDKLRPDVVVTDLAVPGGDGVWLAEQLRGRGERLPIIAVSEYVPAFAERLPGALFTRVLQKPVEPFQLVEVVASAVTS